MLLLQHEVTSETKSGTLEMYNLLIFVVIQLQKDNFLERGVEECCFKSRSKFCSWKFVYFVKRVFKYSFNYSSKFARF